MRIGVDVGGTNTDAVLMEGTRVVASHKAITSENVSDGIVAAIAAVLSASRIDPAEINAVMVGTTHFTNAFVERRGLLEVAVLRLALPATRALPPMVDWPVDLAEVVGRHHYLLRGGYQFDGRVIAPLDESAVAEAARDIRRQGLRAAAISCVFSPINAAMEERVEEILRNEVPDLAITLSSHIGRIGLLERENAAIMNASLADLSHTVVRSFREALQRLRIDAPYFISQNDGTLMSADFVARYPVLTFASGPTNSMRGAAYLSGLKEALVADIGGTTTDIGVLVKGFPRESSVPADIGGVRTNFRMPDVLAMGLGGGSLVTREAVPRVGPRSVGFRLQQRALVFGGDTLTATDIAVASGHARVGDPAAVGRLPQALIGAALDEIHRMLEEGLDRMKTSADPLPLVLVGGGAILVQRELAGVSEVIIPEHAAVANAIGASIAQVGGETDRVYSYELLGRDAAIADARREAINQAIAAGAAPESVEIIDFEELPLSYMPGTSVRLRARAAGALPQC